MKTKKKTQKRKTRSRRNKKKSYKLRYQRGSGVENHTVGKFYLLGSGSGFRPLYLTVRDLSEQQILALSCPPVNPPEPYYSIRGAGEQYDAMLKSALTAEIEIISSEDYRDGKRLTGKIVDVPEPIFTIDIPYNWLDQNDSTWEIIKQSNKVLQEKKKKRKKYF